MKTAATQRSTAGLAGGSIGRRAMRHGSIYVGGTLLQRAVAILLLPFATRVMSVEEFGAAATGTAIATVVSMLASFGLTNTIARFYFDDPDSPRKSWSALLQLQIAFGAVFTAIVFASGPLWSQLLSDVGWTGPLQISVLFGYVLSIQLTGYTVLRSAERPTAFVVGTVLQAVGGGVLGILLARNYGASGYLGGLTLATAASAVLAVILSYRPPYWNKAAIRSGLIVSLPFILHGLSNWGLEVADRMLIAAQLGVAEVARYQVAYSAAVVLPLLVAALQAAWVPLYLGRLSAQQRRALPPLLVIPVCIAAWAASLLLVLVVPPALTVVVPESFGGTETVVALVAGSTAFRAVYLTVAVVLLDRKDSRSIAVASGIGAVLNVVLNLVLLPVMGIAGAGLATVLSFAVQLIIVMRDVERKLELPMRLVEVLAIAGVGAAVLVPVAALPTDASPVTLGARLAVAALALAIGAAAIKKLRGQLAAIDAA
jgi:O-antigen/teichoic acid export membrane protein